MIISSSKTVATALMCILASSFACAQQTNQASTVTPPSNSENPVIFRVGAKEEYRFSDVKAYGMRRTDLVPLLKSTEGIAMVAQEMAMTRALVLEGEKSNVVRDSTQVTSDIEIDDVYALRVYRNVAGTCPEPSTELESKAYYDQNPLAFTLPVQVSINRVILPVSAQPDKFSAEMWLGLQARAVALGSARFEALVDRARGISPELKQGDLGWVLLEGDQPIVKALAVAKEGEMLGPVRDGDFFYLLQVQKRREKSLLSFDTVRHQVPRRAVEYCRETQKTRVKSTLFSKHGIDIDSNAIRKLVQQ